MAAKKPAKNFDLEAKRGEISGPRVGGRKQYPPEDVLRMLSDYVEIPVEFLDSIRYGEYVRYVTRSEGFHPGGLVLKNPLSIANGKNTERLLHLHAGKKGDKNSVYKDWKVNYADIEKIYVKPNAITRVMMRNINNVAAADMRNVETVMRLVESLEERLARLERKYR